MKETGTDRELDWSLLAFLTRLHTNAFPKMNLSKIFSVMNNLLKDQIFFNASEIVR